MPETARKKLYGRIVLLLDRIFTYDGIDPDTLRYKRTYGSQVAIVAFFVALMFIPVLYFKIASLLLYGILLLGWYLVFLAVFIHVKAKLEWLVHLSQHLQLFFTFLVIVRLGGIHNCGGIILAGLSAVILSVIFYSVRWSIWYFTVYVILTVSAALIQWQIQLPAEMSPEVNHLFFLFNTLFITGFTLGIVLVYLDQHTHMERERAERLEELDHVKSDLFANISHEFRTPLTLILGRMDQLEEYPQHGYEDAVRSVRENSQRLLFLVQQMLDLSGLQSKTIELHPVTGEMNAFLTREFEAFREEAEKKKLVYRFQPLSDVLYLDFDHGKMKQLLGNLLSNAIKYTPPGGEISLRCRQEDADLLLLEVADTGIGISTEDQGRIWERFFRVGGGGLARQQGAGLGLPIVREIVQLMNGSIKLGSELGKGTTIRVELPLDTFRSKEISPFSKEMLPDGEEGSLPLLLIVEDQDELGAYLESMLARQYRVIRASDGKEGVEQALKYVPDIILSDVMMPHMDGIAMLDQLKRELLTNHIPVILLTAKVNIMSRLEGLERGADVYLEKPFRKEELLIHLKRLMDQRRSDRLKYQLPLSGEDLKRLDDRYEQRFFSRFHELLKERLHDEDFTVRQMALAAGMSRTQFYRKFSALTGTSPMDYLHKYRLHAARQMLKETNMRVTQIAFEVGFRNLSHFSQRFHQEFGISPSRYRESASD